MRPILTLVFLFIAMVAVSAKPCDVKSHAVPSYQYAIHNEVKAVVFIVVSHDVLGGLVFNVTSLHPNCDLEMGINQVGLPDPKRWQSLQLYTIKNYPVPVITWDNLLKNQFY